MIFYIAVGIGALCAVSDWRAGIMIAIILDCFRDPVRKLSEGEPTLTTYCIGFVWAAAFVNLLFGNARSLQIVRRRLPWLERAITWYLLGLVPGAAISLMLYQNGVLLAGLGGASYAAPLLGVALGVALAFELKCLKRILQIYVIVNSITFIGSVAEYLQWDWPALGGIGGFEWIRHMPGVIVRLISGFFRSPDIAGFHAANSMMVSAILLLNRGDKPRHRRRINPVWLGTALWSLVPLILCGRRKMLIMPIVFIVTYLLYLRLASRRSTLSSIIHIALIVSIGAVPLLVYRDDLEVRDHQEYYATTISDVAPRLKENVAGGVIVTLQQSGVVGSGLGVATQGAQHFAVEARRDAWQEDGVSRLFKELGLPGAALVLCAIVIAVRGCYRQISRQRYLPLIELQGLILAVVFANLASFVASHQHFSGDPANALWVLTFLGIFLGLLSLDQPGTRRPGSDVMTQ